MNLPIGYDEHEKQEAEKEGERAYEHGGERSQNPYRGQDRRRWEWLVGYNRARDMDMAQE